MIQIDMQRECETRYYSAQKQTNYSDYEDEQCNNQTESCACTYQTDLELNGMSPTSPVMNSQSSPCFNNKLSSPQFKESFSEDTQIKNIESPSGSYKIGQSCLNNNKLSSKSHQILSPTPIKAMNLTKTFLSISTSNTLSYCQSSAISSQSSSSSYISTSCQKSDACRTEGNCWQNSKSHSFHKLNKDEIDLSHSFQDEFYFSDELDYQIKNKGNKDFSTSFQMMNQTQSQNIDNLQNTQEIISNNIQQRPNHIPWTQNYYIKGDYNDSNLRQNHRGQKVKGRLFIQNQITQFTLEDNNTRNVQIEENKLNLNSNIFSQSHPNRFEQKDSQSTNSILHYSQSAPHPTTLFNHESCQDDILNFVQIIERESAQNPQSKDEEFLNLNSSFYTEETFEQFKESILQDLLDKSF